MLECPKMCYWQLQYAKLTFFAQSNFFSTDRTKSIKPILLHKVNTDKKIYKQIQSCEEENELNTIYVYIFEFILTKLSHC